jgi:hypothetical protein
MKMTMLGEKLAFLKGVLTSGGPGCARATLDARIVSASFVGTIIGNVIEATSLDFKSLSFEGFGAYLEPLSSNGRSSARYIRDTREKPRS